MSKEFFMKWIRKLIVSVTGIILILTVFVAAGCTKSRWEEGKLRVATTTTMLADLVRNIGGDTVSVVGLMNTGIDPHSYKPKMGDTAILGEADIIIYSGLHLEGRMTDLFDKMKDRKLTVAVGDKIKENNEALLISEGGDIFDPHIWFDTNLWSMAADYVAEALIQSDSDNTDSYQANLTAYKAELIELDNYIKNRVQELEEEKRVLITAHDAFGYFAKAYGFEVMGIQGISTDAEAAINRITELANFIHDNGIKAIFTENAVNDNTIKALTEAVRSKGSIVKIGGELYADSLGDEKTNTESYIASFKYNIDTIVNALK